MASRSFALVITAVATLLLAMVVMAAGGIRDLAITVVDVTGFPTSRVYFSVSDIDGLPLTDLGHDEIELYENDVSIAEFDVVPTEHPLLIGVVIDSAVSFNAREGSQTRLEHGKEVARWLIAPQYDRLALDDEIAIFAFQAGQPVRLVDFTYDHQLILDQGIAPVSTQGNNFTALFDILRQAILETATREGARRRILLVFSDGVDRTSGVDVDRVIDQAREAHLVIYTVGLGSDLAPDRPSSAFLRRLADETGGSYVWYRPTRSDSEEGVTALLDGLVAQRQGHMVVYSSAQYQGSPQIRLTARRGGTRAEDRVSYEVPPLPPAVTLDAVRPGDILTGAVVVRASVSRAQREIERVEYWIGDQLVYTARAAPWEFEWDTRPFSSSSTDYDEHTLRVIACDLQQQCSVPYEVVIGTRLPLPTPTALPAPTAVVITQTEWAGPVSNPFSIISLLSLLVSVVALVVLTIYLRRGGGQSVGRVVQEVRRKTRVWMSQTRIFGGDEGNGAGHPMLTVVSEKQNGKTFQLQEQVLFLGRDAERADVVFEWDDYISRRHVKVALEGDQWYVWDLNSANGTWLNQSRVRASLSEGLDIGEAVLIADGDVLHLGPELAVRLDLAHVPSQSPKTDDPTDAMVVPQASEPQREIRDEVTMKFTSG